MNINLTPKQEEIVKDELKAGHFRTVEELIDEALQVLREKERFQGRLVQIRSQKNGGGIAYKLRWSFENA